RPARSGVARAARAAAMSVRGPGWWPSLHPSAQIARAILAQHNDENDHNDDGGRRAEFVAIESGVERGADAAAADNTDHGGLAEIDVETIKTEPDHAWHHLRLHPVIDPLQPARARRPHGFRLRRVH